MTDFHPTIQAAIRFLGGATLQEIADKEKVTKQAIHKRVQEGIEHIKRCQDENSFVAKSDLDLALKEKEHLIKLTQHLRQELILNSVERQLLRFFKARVLEIFPKFKPGRLPAHEKKLFSINS